MAKRIYAPKIVSPEVARENAISIARANVHNCRNDVKRSQISQKLVVAAETDPTLLDNLAECRAHLAFAEAELAQAEAYLATLGA